MKKKAGVLYSVEISDEEKKRYKEIKKYYTELSNRISDFSALTETLSDSVMSVTSTDKAYLLTPSLIKFVHIMKDKFNDAIKFASGLLRFFVEKEINDIEIEEENKILLESIKQLHENFVELVKITKNITRAEEFEELKAMVDKIQKGCKELQDLILNEIIFYINKNILVS